MPSEAADAERLKAQRASSEPVEGGDADTFVRSAPRQAVIPKSDARPMFQKRASTNPLGPLESSGREPDHAAAHELPPAIMDERRAIKSRPGWLPRPTPRSRLIEAAKSAHETPKDERSDEQREALRRGTELLKYGNEQLDLMEQIDSRDSRSLAPSTPLTTGERREVKKSVQRDLVKRSRQANEPISEAIDESDAGPGSRDERNGYVPLIGPLPRHRDVDRDSFPATDDRPEFDPRPSQNPHGTLEPSGKRDYPLGENFVPLATMDNPRTSERFRAARNARSAARQEKRAGMTAEERAAADSEEELAKQDRTDLRRAMRPSREALSADTGQAMRSSAGYQQQKRFMSFEQLANQQRQVQSAIATDQGKIDRSRFGFGNLGKWFGGLFFNRSRRQRIAQAQQQLGQIDAQASALGIADFSDATGDTLRAQAEFEQRLPKTGQPSRTFADTLGRTQNPTLATDGDGHMRMERSLLQRAGLVATESLGERPVVEGERDRHSTIASAVNERVSTVPRVNGVSTETIDKWGSLRPSAGAAIPEASIEDEEVDERAERDAQLAQEKERQDLFTGPLPTAAARRSVDLAGAGGGLDTGAGRRRMSVGGTDRGRLANWEAMERRYDDADLEFAIKRNNPNLIGARENVPPTPIPADTSAARQQELYRSSPEEFGFHAPLLPEGVTPGRRMSTEVPERTGDPLAEGGDDVRTAQDSLGDRLRGREEGTGTLEGGRDWFGNAEIGGYRSSIGGFRDLLAQHEGINPMDEVDFLGRGRERKGGPKFATAQDVVAAANRPQRDQVNPLLGLGLWGVVPTHAKPKAAPKKVAEKNAAPAQAAPRRGILKNAGEKTPGGHDQMQAEVDQYLAKESDPTLDDNAKRALDTTFRHETTEGERGNQYALLLNLRRQKAKDIGEEQRYDDEGMYDDVKDAVAERDYARMLGSRDAQAEVPGAAPAYGLSERARKLAEFNARPGGLAEGPERKAGGGKSVRFAAQKAPKRRGGWSLFKPSTWGASAAPMTRGEQEGPAIPEHLQGPVLPMPPKKPRAPRTATPPVKMNEPVQMDEPVDAPQQASQDQVSMIDTSLSPEQRQREASREAEEQQREALREAFGSNYERDAHKWAEPSGRKLKDFSEVADFIGSSGAFGDQAPRPFDPFQEHQDSIRKRQDAIKALESLPSEHERDLKDKEAALAFRERSNKWWADRDAREEELGEDSPEMRAWLEDNQRPTAPRYEWEKVNALHADIANNKDPIDVVNRSYASYRWRMGTFNRQQDYLRRYAPQSPSLHADPEALNAQSAQLDAQMAAYRQQYEPAPEPGVQDPVDQAPAVEQEQPAVAKVHAPRGGVPFADLGRDIRKGWADASPMRMRERQQAMQEQQTLRSNVLPEMKSNNRLRNLMHFMRPLQGMEDDPSAAEAFQDRIGPLTEAGLANTFSGRRANAMDRGVHAKREVPQESEVPQEEVPAASGLGPITGYQTAQGDEDTASGHELRMAMERIRRR